MRLRLAPAALVAISLLVAGCGDDGDDEATGRDDPTTTSTEGDSPTTSDTTEGTEAPEPGPDDTTPPPAEGAAPDLCDRVGSLAGLEETLATGDTEAYRQAAAKMRDIADAAPAVEADLVLMADVYEKMAETVPGAESPEVALLEAMDDLELDPNEVMLTGERIREYVDGECPGS